ncbi:MAG: DoxX family protein [Bacteroidales bacterium]|nr:DoxX family protein [Bacteroidales bacterium]
MKHKILNYTLTIVRLLIGWHFLYEGISKLFTPGWTSKVYLENSLWLGKDFFASLASSPVLLQSVDMMNIFGLTLIGLALILGFKTRIASWFGVAFLFMYFIAYPPIPGYTFGGVNEGSYLWVNKNLIELGILLYFALADLNWHYGVDRLFKEWREEKAHAPIPSEPRKERESGTGAVARREVLRDLIGVPVLGAFAYAAYKKNRWESFEKKYLLENQKADAVSGATIKTFQFSRLSELKGQTPKGKIKGLELSRMIMGGNLIGGWAHARDLIYVDKLVKAYHDDDKIMQTLLLGEKCGMNALLTNPQLSRIINKYRHELRSNLKFISDCGYKSDFFEGIKVSIDGGADMLYCQGELTDRWAQEGRLADIGKGIDLIRQNGLPAGIGAHRIESIKACVEYGIKPDFWVKTLHHHNYWSAQPGSPFKDNMFCDQPEETIRYMNELEAPWIAFKVLAAGALTPQDGFQYAFNNGADFICVGMYDFQIVDDTNILLDVLSKVERTRPWRG